MTRISFEIVTTEEFSEISEAAHASTISEILDQAKLDLLTVDDLYSDSAIVEALLNAGATG